MAMETAAKEKLINKCPAKWEHPPHPFRHIIVHTASDDDGFSFSTTRDNGGGGDADRTRGKSEKLSTLICLLEDGDSRDATRWSDSGSSEAQF